MCRCSTDVSLRMAVHPRNTAGAGTLLNTGLRRIADAASQTSNDQQSMRATIGCLESRYADLHVSHLSSGATGVRRARSRERASE
jgi:hypothetical protein